MFFSVSVGAVVGTNNGTNTTIPNTTSSVTSFDLTYDNYEFFSNTTYGNNSNVSSDYLVDVLLNSNVTIPNGTTINWTYIDYTHGGTSSGNYTLTSDSNSTWLSEILGGVNTRTALNLHNNMTEGINLRFSNLTSGNYSATIYAINQSNSTDNFTLASNFTLVNITTTPTNNTNSTNVTNTTNPFNNSILSFNLSRTEDTFYSNTSYGNNSNVSGDYYVNVLLNSTVNLSNETKMYYNYTFNGTTPFTGNYTLNRSTNKIWLSEILNSTTLAPLNIRNFIIERYNLEIPGVSSKPGTYTATIYAINTSNPTDNFTLASKSVTISSPITSSTSSAGGTGTCTTQWTCTAWSSCTNGIQTRTCSFPENYCTPTSAEPVTSQSCVSTPAQNNSNNTKAQSTTKRGRGITGFAVAANDAVSSTGGIIILAVIALGLGGTLLIDKRKKKSSKKASK